MNDSLFYNISGVVLAGGKSSRMGKDKALISFGDSDTLTQYQYEKLRGIFHKVYISTKEDKFDFINKESLIFDTSDISSPMVALRSILNSVEDQKVFIMAVDTPLVLSKTISEIVDYALKTSFDIVVAKDTEGNRHNLCAVFDRSILPLIDKCIDEDIHKLNYLIDKTNFKELEFGVSDQFLNINTEKVYTKAVSLIN
ncbi:MAG: NTP transferase domain-containing protein [Campylobacterota bacterium]|nr:NTP transferase domain-containing protein [Campylobacterota bacterium]